MTISNHADTFAGHPVRDFDPDAKANQAKRVYRLSIKYDDKRTFPELLDLFLSKYGGKELGALVIGPWGYDHMINDGSGEVVEALVAARDRMPNLKALYFGDVTFTECEISWINHGDISALLPAFPKLEEFRIRGVGRLTFGKLKHLKLKSFAIESGGLPEALLHEVWDSDLPRLEHLELWLGTNSYGGIDRVAPLKKLLNGNRFAKLRYLGLRNSDIADAVAEAAAKSPLLKRVKTLDLSMGNLGDGGAEALLASPAVRKLQALDIHHHYVTPAVVARLKKLGPKLNAGEARTPEVYDDKEYRYNSVSE